MNIKVWNDFSKRANSTKIPETQGTNIQCTLKGDTSIESPVFILNSPMPNWTYVQAFGHYYFVTDVKNLNNTMSELYCSQDTLATYRNDIFNYTCYVERSASNYDVFLRDPALSSRQLFAVDDVANTDVTDIFNPTGLYCTTVLNKEYGLVLYLTNSLSMYKIILDSGLYDRQSIDDWILSGISASYDLDVYIGSVQWFPLSLQSVGANANSFAFGPISISVDSPKIPSGSIIKIATPSYRVGEFKALNLPSPYYNDFRDCDPRFTQYSVSLPGVGTVQLDSALVGSCIHNNRTLYDYILIDLSTGQITHQIETVINGQGVNFCSLKGQIGVNVPLGKSKANTIDTLSTFIGGESQAIGSLMGGSSGIASGIGTTLVTGLQTIDSYISPQTSMIGGSGNHTDLYVNSQYIKINRKVIGSKEFALSVAGRPLCQNVRLGALSGFCKCGNASIPLAAKSVDINSVNAYLNNGFYIE